MGWKRVLWRILGGQDNTQPQTQPRPAPAPAAATVQAHTGPGAAERFAFQDGLKVTGGGGTRIGKYSPQPGCVVVEIYDSAGRLLALDVFSAPVPAPGGPWKPLPHIHATKVVPGMTNRPHQEFEFDLNGDHPIVLPQHLLDKIEIGGVTAKVWWSCRAQ
jgi:hypothetical protein